MNLKKLFHINNDNLAVPEIHTEEFDELQKRADEEENEIKKKENIVYENVAVPEIHLHRKKKSK